MVAQSLRDLETQRLPPKMDKILDLDVSEQFLRVLPAGTQSCIERFQPLPTEEAVEKTEAYLETDGIELPK